jgi:uncharacterized membrane protein YeaQ/YmgE (transglycosylase-associated protein family)
MHISMQPFEFDANLMRSGLAGPVGRLEGKWLQGAQNMHIIWLILIGFIAGVIAKFLHPGSANEPSGFILTTALGIAGSFVATYLGQALGWYQAGEGAGFIGAVVGAIIVLVVWGIIARARAPKIT